MQLLRGLKDLKKAKGGGGFLTNKIIQIQSYSVRVENVLGEGGFATIYRCSDNTTKATFALKHFRLSGHAEAVAGVKAEVEVMKALRSDPNVLNIRAYSFSGPSGAEEEAYVLLDYCKDNLVGYLQARNFKLDSLSVLRVFLPVCRAVQSMHHMDPPRAHRDLKAENVLLHEKDYWVLCDFGSATSAQQVYSNQRDIALEEENIRRHTTPAYRAPEMWDLYSREFIGVQVDVWALGCLLYLLCFGRLPFDGEAKLQILNGQYSMPTSQPEQLRSLIRGMLVTDARQRMRIDEVVSRVEQMAPPDLLRSLPTQASAPPSTVSASPSQGSIDSQYADAAGAPSRHANSPDRQRAKGQPSRLSQQGDGQMWASFESTPLATATGTGAAAAAAPPPSRPQLYPTVGSPPPPASSTQRGQHKVPAGREPSWASFESSGSRPSAAAAAGSSRPCTATPSQNSTPAAAAEGAGLPGEGPLSAGMAGLLAGSPPAAPRLTPYPGRGVAGSAAHPQPAPQHQFEVRLSGGQPVSMAMPEAACTPGGGSSGRRQQEAPSSTRPFGLQPGSLPSSPMHSRGSSRNVDRISRSSFDSLAGNAVSASPQNKVDHSFAEAEQLQLHTARLEEHCRVLEQLLEERNAEVRALRETNARQYEELQQLKGARQQSQQNGQQTAAKPMPGSDNMQDVDMHSKLHLEVHDGGGAESSWVAFGGSGLLEDAPTPTVIKSKGRPQPPVEPPGTAFATSPATPFGEVLGAKLDLGGAGMPDQDCRSNQQQQGEGPSRAQLGGSQTSGSMLSGRTGSGSSLGGWDRQLPFEEFNPLSGDPDTRKVLRMQDLGKPVGGRAGAVSAQPSPAKGFVGPCVEASGSVLGSPPKSRRGASLLQGSPTKGPHRRHISEPFFNDLNPLG